MARKEPAAATDLGPLGSRIMELLWQGGEMRVRDIHAKLGTDKAAQTSVAVTLDRLYDKSLVKRRTQQGRGGLYYLYSAKTSKDEYRTTVIRHAVDGLVERFGPSAVSYFNERFGEKRTAK